ncbi:hypothetical protein MHYP_G00333260 [Metynnis hypsauchen]
MALSIKALKRCISSSGSPGDFADGVKWKRHLDALSQAAEWMDMWEEMGPLVGRGGEMRLAEALRCCLTLRSPLSVSLFPIVGPGVQISTPSTGTARKRSGVEVSPPPSQSINPQPPNNGPLQVGVNNDTMVEPNCALCPSDKANIVIAAA